MGNYPVKVFAPASVANVAVGYDILGFALDQPGDDILVKEGTAPGLIIKEIKGAQGKLPLEVTKNTAGVAALNLMKHVGLEDQPIEMTIHKKMPFGSGLGSSAASAAAGVFAVNTYLKTGLTKREILKFAVEGEQIADGAYHADNVGPSLLGGMLLIRDNATLDIKKLHIPKGLCCAIIYPQVQVMTSASRAILSKNVDFEKVILQSGNLASFIAAMYTSDIELMSRSLNDLLVEPQRAHLIPHFYKMKEAALDNGALGFSISGAGPSMFALCANTLVAENIVEKGKAIYKDVGIAANCFYSGINHEGAIIY